MIFVRELVKNFGDRAVLRGVTFDIRRGESLAVLGDHDAGKTTLLRLLCGILEPTGGQIELADPDIPILPHGRGFKARVGYFPAEPFLFEYLTGREMLHFIATLYHVPREEAAGRVDYYLRMMNFDGDADRIMKEYTPGMRRKVSLIGSLLHHPLYWFLDEPTDGLDPAAARTLTELVARMKEQGRAVVLCTRRAPMAKEVCDRVLILRRGSVAFDGAAGDLAGKREAALDLASAHGAPESAGPPPCTPATA